MRGRSAVFGAAGLAAAIAAATWWSAPPASRDAAPPDPAAAARAAELRARGDRVQAAGRPYRAVEFYLRAQREWADDPETWRRLAAAALAAGQAGNAERAAAQVLAARPGDGAALAARAAARALPTPAVAPGGRARALTRRRCAWARRLVERGRLDEAATVLAAAAWLDDRAVMPWRYRANVAYLQGRLADAVAYQREAVARAPGDAFLRRNLAALEAAASAPTPGG